MVKIDSRYNSKNNSYISFQLKTVKKSKASSRSTESPLFAEPYPHFYGKSHTHTFLLIFGISFHHKQGRGGFQQYK